MHKDISRIRLGFICIKLSLDTCGVLFYKYLCKRHIFSIYDSISEKGVGPILGVAEPFVPTTHGRQPFIPKITLTLIFSLIPTHLVVETKP